MKSKISVVIPFYSNFVWLEEALISVLNQTYKNVEIIVINDGSLEDDKLFLSHFGEKITYIKTRNQGPAKARNLGIENASGDYIAFLDSDDLWHSDKLESQLNFMFSENFEWSHTNYELFNDSDRKTIKTINVSNFRGNVFIKCLVSSPIATPCIMIRKSFLTQYQDVRFSEQMRYGEDGFMWLNAALYSPLGVINQCLTKVRMRGENAALKAAVHLQVKSQLWTYLRNKNKNNINNKFNAIPLIIQFAYWLSHENFILFNLLTNSTHNKSFVEFLAKILYLPTYIILKIYNYKLKKNVQE